MRFLLQSLALISLLLASQAVLAGDDCEVCKVVRSDESADALAKIADNAPQIVRAADLKDVPRYCRVNGYRDSLSMLHEWGQTLKYNPWVGDFVAAKDRRESMLGAEMNYLFPLSTPLDAVLGAKPLTEAALNQCESEIDESADLMGRQEDEEKASMTQALFLCQDLTVVHALPCTHALQYLVKLTKPINDKNLFEVWREVLKDPSYFNVMKSVALKNLKRINAGEIPKTRFFDDLEQAFFAELHDREESIDHTFKLLGVLASDGNNTFLYIPCPTVPFDFRTVIFALNIGSAILDRSTAQVGFLYTYPKEVDSLCDYGKNYHFWMTAFLAREAMKDSDDLIASAAAAFTMNKGYQFIKTGNGRHREYAFRRHTFSNYSNNMRLDMAQASAGAWFGATSVKSFGAKKLNREQFEAGLRKIFEGSNEQSGDIDFKFPEVSQTTEILSTFAKWKNIMNPDAAFNYYQKEMGY